MKSNALAVLVFSRLRRSVWALPLAVLALETRRVDVEAQQVLSTTSRGRAGVHAMPVLSGLGRFFFLRKNLQFDRAHARHAQALLEPPAPGTSGHAATPSHG